MRVIKVKDREQAIKQALAVLKKGGLVIYPTETCYGLGADATNSVAVRKVLEFKGQRKGKPISVAVVDRKMAGEYVIINQTADNLYQQFLPGPLTVVSRSRGKTISALEAGKKTLGIRVPDSDLALGIVKAFGKPITSTSANASGKKTPYCLNDVLKYTSQNRLALVDFFLDAGKLSFHLPSTVVDTTLNEPEILRQGEINIVKTKSNSFISNCEAATKQVAKKIFKKYQDLLKKKTLIFALQGELGSGKTQFVKGLGQVLKIKDSIVSPTFTIIREYPLKLNLQRSDLCKSGMFYHLDTWRLEKGEELLDLGLEEMLKPGNVIVIEWLQKIRPILARLAKNKRVQLVWINIEHISETKRRISYQD